MQNAVFDRDRVLLTSPHVALCRQADGTLRLDTPDTELVFAAHDADRVVAMVESAIEPRSTAQLTRDRPRDIALIDVALDAGALRDVTAFIRSPTSAAQLDAYYVLCDSWARDIFLDPFWTKVLSGEASTRLMLGWCEQFYHRTVGADEHNEVAVAYCDLPGVALALAKHFREEQGHGEIFLQGLEEAGVDRRMVADRPPLPSTRALIDFFSDLGRTDTLAYLACYGVLHSPREGQTLEAVRTQFSTLRRAYPGAEPALRRVAQHAEIDVQAGHDQIVFEPYLLSRAPLCSSEAKRVLASVRGTVVTFKRFFDGILAAYDGDQSR
ncbi:iron-containing redox enzyme family protein [Sphingomonas sp. MMS24-J45]|uniref:iron-containing redox enzyme family protein n=1 Tax=Sphingomonas sp. MMS24-J45 TaxID=3238806 RepID=UPI00384EFE80